jgi:arylsulfatase
MSLTADGGAPGSGGVATLFINGRKVGEGRIARTQCCMFSLDEGTDVGLDEGTPVTEAYASPFAFTGTIRKVTVAITPSGTPATPAP